MEYTSIQYKKIKDHNMEHVEVRNARILTVYAPRSPRTLNQCWSRTPFLITGRRKLVGGPGFEKMGVATLNMIFSVTNSKCLAQLSVNCSVVSPTLNVNPTLFVIQFFWMIVDL